MGDLISRSAMLEFAHNHVNGAVDCNDIARFPDVDAEHVRHGHWIPEDDRWTKYMCSICRVTGCGGFEKFCPNCGARMDAEEKT